MLIKYFVEFVKLILIIRLFSNPNKLHKLHLVNINANKRKTLMILLMISRSYSTFWHRRLGACLLSSVQECASGLRQGHLERC